MNKLIRLLSVLALASTVAFVSCKGDTGPEGPRGENGTNGTNGTNGQNGNANVKSFTKTINTTDWNEIDRTSIGTSATGKWGAASIANSEITANKTVFAYAVVGNEETQLPTTLVVDAIGAEERYEIGKQTGQLNIYYRSKASNGTFSYLPSKAINIKYIVIEETVAANLRTAGVSTSDYNAVINYLNRKATIPTQL
jgi:hypothetical protein